MDDNGYVWTDFGPPRSWSGTRGWPVDPSRGQECKTDQEAATTGCLDTRRTNNNTAFVLANNHYFQWTNDVDFLRQNIERIRKAIHFLQTETYDDGFGILEIHFKNYKGRDATLADRTDITKSDLSNNWNDVLPFGWRDAHATIYYYAVLLAMSDLEKSIELHPEWEIPQNPFGENSSSFMAKAARVREIAGNYFWFDPTWKGGDPSTKDFSKGRFLGTVDVNGNIHDYGFIDLNLQSIFYGLASTQQAQAIYNWITGNGQNEFSGDTSRGADIYKFEFAPRITTKHNINWHIYGSGGGQYWEDYIENGGASLHNSFYDIMTRLKVAGPDDAFNRLNAILSWYRRTQSEGGYWDYYNYQLHPERGKMAGCPGDNPHASNGLIGLTCEFTESTLVSMSFLYGFLGIEAKSDGLHINPNLPAGLSYAGVERLFYQGKYYNIRAQKTGESGLTYLGDDTYSVTVVNGQEFIVSSGPPFGDLDGDQDIDAQDLKILLENWGGTPSLPAADLNSDGIVNGLDFGEMLRLIQ